MKDPEIKAALLRRDETAIRYVMDRYSRLLWSVVSAVLARMGMEEDMEECVADVFVYLWEHPEKFDPTRGTLRSWLCVVARSRATDRWRRLSKQEHISMEDMWLTDTMVLADEDGPPERRQILLEAIQALPEREREALVRRYYYEQKPRHIARAMDIPVKQADNLLYRAKQKLKRSLTDETEKS